MVALERPSLYLTVADCYLSTETGLADYRAAVVRAVAEKQIVTSLRIVAAVVVDYRPGIVETGHQPLEPHSCPRTVTADLVVVVAVLVRVASWPSYRRDLGSEILMAVEFAMLVAHIADVVVSSFIQKNNRP